MKPRLDQLFAYTDWANNKLLDLAEQITPDQFDSASGYSHSSLHDTLFHMLRTEWVWRTLAQQGRITAAPPRVEDFPSVAALRAGWQAEAERRRAFFEGLTDAVLAGPLVLTDRDGNTHRLTLWHMLLHAALHSAQHRSEVAALLTHYGRSPGDLDFIFFIQQPE
jgi:uncharacterized damage-inducible protein DinB